MKNLFLAITALLLFGCKSQKSLNTLELSPTQSIVFLDSIPAAKAIIQDEVDNFFEHIQIVDMAIQMKRNYPAATTRDQVVVDYKKFLQEDVADFSKEEIAFVEEVWNEVYVLTNKVSPAIFPKQIRLIKTHAKHYGASVYYTREDCIVIPKYAMEAQNRDAFKSTMLHELFHIYSRYNPEKKDALYKVIGFSKVGDISTLSMQDSLKQRVLLNPDGINFAYAIELKDKDGKEIYAIPIIASNEFDFSKSKPQFFDYLAFNLYEIQAPYSRMINVKSKSNGDSTISFRDFPSFFEQIRDNTGYIIHPDEVLADNFIYVCMTKDQPDFQQRFSAPGKELLKLIEEILSN